MLLLLPVCFCSCPLLRLLPLRLLLLLLLPLLFLFTSAFCLLLLLLVSPRPPVLVLLCTPVLVLLCPPYLHPDSKAHTTSHLLYLCCLLSTPIHRHRLPPSLPPEYHYLKAKSRFAISRHITTSHCRRHSRCYIYAAFCCHCHCHCCRRRRCYCFSIPIPITVITPQCHNHAAVYFLQLNYCRIESSGTTLQHLPSSHFKLH